MRLEKEIQERIDELELRDENEWDYLDEGEQSELATLHWVLGEDA